MPSADEWITALGMEPHPEGGHFREIHRGACTSIYYLLRAGESSRLHRLPSDEIWHHHDGGTAIVHVLHPDGRYELQRVGLDPESGTMPQAVIPAGAWFGASVEGDFTLVGCTVAPAFQFSDLQLGRREVLLQRFPQHAAVINRLTPEPVD